MRIRSNRVLSAAGLVLALAGANACVATAIVAGAAATFGIVMYSENEAVRDFDAGLGPTWSATVAAMRTLGYPVADGAAHGLTEGRVEVHDVKVRVTREPGDFTRVRVRVGTFRTEEHRRRAGLILEEVARLLE